MNCIYTVRRKFALYGREYHHGERITTNDIANYQKEEQLKRLNMIIFTSVEVEAKADGQKEQEKGRQKGRKEQDQIGLPVDEDALISKARADKSSLTDDERKLLREIVKRRKEERAKDEVDGSEAE